MRGGGGARTAVGSEGGVTKEGLKKNQNMISIKSEWLLTCGTESIHVLPPVYSQ